MKNKEIQEFKLEGQTGRTISCNYKDYIWIGDDKSCFGYINHLGTLKRLRKSLDDMIKNRSSKNNQRKSSSKAPQS